MGRPTLLSRCSAYLIQFTKGSLNYLNQAQSSLLEYGYHGQLTAISICLVLFLISFSIDNPENLVQCYMGGQCFQYAYMLMNIYKIMP